MQLERLCGDTRDLVVNGLKPLKDQCQVLKTVVATQVLALSTDVAQTFAELEAKVTESANMHVRRADMGLREMRTEKAAQLEGLGSQLESHQTRVAALEETLDETVANAQEIRQACAAIVKGILAELPGLSPVLEGALSSFEWQGDHELAVTLLAESRASLPQPPSQSQVRSPGRGNWATGRPSPELLAAEVQSGLREALMGAQDAALQPLVVDLDNLRRDYEKCEEALTEQRRVHTEITDVCADQRRQLTSLETQKSELAAQNKDLVGKLRRLEELERSQGEIDMLANLQRTIDSMESVNENQAVKAQLEEATRKHDAAMKQQGIANAKERTELRVQFAAELERVQAQHRELVSELEARIKAERTRYRDLQDQTHRQVQELEQDMSVLQELYDGRSS